MGSLWGNEGRSITSKYLTLSHKDFSRSLHLMGYDEPNIFYS